MEGSGAPAIVTVAVARQLEPAVCRALYKCSPESLEKVDKFFTRVAEESRSLNPCSDVPGYRCQLRQRLAAIEQRLPKTPDLADRLLKQLPWIPLRRFPRSDDQPMSSGSQAVSSVFDPKASDEDKLRIVLLDAAGVAPAVPIELLEGDDDHQVIAVVAYSDQPVCLLVHRFIMLSVHMLGSQVQLMRRHSPCLQHICCIFP